MIGLAGIKVAAGAASSALQTFSGKIPVWLRWTLLGLVIAAAGFLWHQHAAHKAIAAAEKRGADAAYLSIAKKANEIAAKMNATNRQLAQIMRSKTDEDLADNARAADAYRLHGPGAARCPALASLPRSASGHGQTAAEPNAAGPEVSADDRAAVPWGWLVDRSEEHDALLIENKAWRDWYSTFKGRWDQFNAEAEKARSAPPNASAPTP